MSIVITVTCRFCKKKFQAKPSWIAYGNAKFCSRECQHRAYRKGKTVNCFICGKAVYKALRSLKRTSKYFCSKSCQTRWRNTFFSGPKHANWKGGNSIAYRGLLIKQNIPKICHLCKTSDFRVLAVHHRDENRKNNDVKNLMWLCHNCHFLIHHYDEEREKLMVPVA